MDCLGITGTVRSADEVLRPAAAVLAVAYGAVSLVLGVQVDAELLVNILDLVLRRIPAQSLELP